MISLVYVYNVLLHYNHNICQELFLKSPRSYHSHNVTLLKIDSQHWAILSILCKILLIRTNIYVIFMIEQSMLRASFLSVLHNKILHYFGCLTDKLTIMTRKDFHEH